MSLFKYVKILDPYDAIMPVSQQQMLLLCKKTWNKEVWVQKVCLAVVHIKKKIWEWEYENSSPPH